MPQALVSAVQPKDAALFLNGAVQASPTTNPWDKEAMFRAIGAAQAAQPSDAGSKFVALMPTVSPESWAIYLSDLLERQAPMAPALVAAARRIRGS